MGVPLREGFNYFSDGSTDFSCNRPIKVKTLLREKECYFSERYKYSPARSTEFSLLREKQLHLREIQLLLCEQYLLNL
jgi:hypothetical protein